ncbi:hypothetical protein GCM10012275_52970 [Longimycelium tulufanense]|uniref:Uncharacterized protein n=1 Tax=Longimycelium tulufanense TaxID=907463 RepID=A0A8J3CD18_9PSEU|nr:hypothetical protein GCM10012275_52970 [Longimycelium tulufanense]
MRHGPKLAHHTAPGVLQLRAASIPPQHDSGFANDSNAADVPQKMAGPTLLELQAHQVCG